MTSMPLEMPNHALPPATKIETMSMMTVMMPLLSLIHISCLGKEIEVAIDGAPTHALVDGANIEKDIFGGGVIAPCAHGVENQLTLARVASQRRSL